MRVSRCVWVAVGCLASAPALATTGGPPIVDSDTDGLSDDEEEDLGTDPGDQDTDSDALNDFEEVRTYGSDPLDFDSDDDGLEDGAEVAVGTDLFDADTDADGFGDGLEFGVGSDPLDAADIPDLRLGHYQGGCRTAHGAPGLSAILLLAFIRRSRARCA